MEMYDIVVGPMGVNCYIILSKAKRAAVIDPGFDSSRIMKIINENEATLDKILLTHGHFDHIGAVKELKKETGAAIYIHEKDSYRLDKAHINPIFLFDGLDSKDYDNIPHDVSIKEGDIIKLDEIYFEVLHTPGHTEGSVTFKAGKTLFTGDTLFCGTVGRTDLEGGNYEEIIASVKRLGEMEEDMAVMPGHGEKSTIGYERRTNPYLGRADYDAVF